MGHILAITGDHHSNSTVGLHPPTFWLDDGNPIGQSDRQKWIWARWKHYWGAVNKTKEHTGWPVTSIMLGELADDISSKHKSSQVVTTNPSDMINLAVRTLGPAMEVADDIVVLRGTEAHSGTSSNLDETVAREIGAQRSPMGTYSWWQFRATYSGVTIDAAHHPGTSSRVPHTSGNEANRLASKLFYEYSIENVIKTRRGKDIIPWPHLAVRGHNHKPADSGDNQPGGHPDAAIRTIITPAWKFGTSFGYRIAGSKLPIGGLMVTCNQGRYKVHKLYYWPDTLGVGAFPSADGYGITA